jgi:hypothetical protein
LLQQGPEYIGAFRVEKPEYPLMWGYDDERCDIIAVKEMA